MSHWLAILLHLSHLPEPVQIFNMLVIQENQLYIRSVLALTSCVGSTEMRQKWLLNKASLNGVICADSRIMEKAAHLSSSHWRLCFVSEAYYDISLISIKIMSTLEVQRKHIATEPQGPNMNSK